MTADACYEESQSDSNSKRVLFTGITPKQSTDINAVLGLTLVVWACKLHFILFAHLVINVTLDMWNVLGFILINNLQQETRTQRMQLDDRYRTGKSRIASVSVRLTAWNDTFKSMNWPSRLVEWLFKDSTQSCSFGLTMTSSCIDYTMNQHDLDFTNSKRRQLSSIGCRSGIDGREGGGVLEVWPISRIKTTEQELTWVWGVKQNSRRDAEGGDHENQQQDPIDYKRHLLPVMLDCLLAILLFKAELVLFNRLVDFVQRSKELLLEGAGVLAADTGRGTGVRSGWRSGTRRLSRWSAAYDALLEADRWLSTVLSRVPLRHFVEAWLTAVRVDGSGKFLIKKWKQPVCKMSFVEQMGNMCSIFTRWN